MKTSPSFFELASSRKIILPSLKVALIVGTLLVLINHANAILEMGLNGERVFQIILTYCIPYCVSTYSAVKAIQQSGKVR